MQNLTIHNHLNFQELNAWNHLTIVNICRRNYKASDKVILRINANTVRITIGHLEKFNFDGEPADETHVLFRPRPLRLFGLRQFFVVPHSN